MTIGSALTGKGGEVEMSATESVVNDLNIAKLMLCKPQMLTPEMCIRIGQAVTSAIAMLKEQPEIVRCKDCKHKPEFERKDNYGNWYKFPDDICPCQNGSDDYYSYCPEDDWFCADGERKGGDGDG